MRRVIVHLGNDFVSGLVEVFKLGMLRGSQGTFSGVVSTGISLVYDDDDDDDIY